MAQHQFGRAALANNAPNWLVQSSITQSNATNIPLGNNTFGNTTIGPFVNNAVIGTYGVNNAIAASVGKKVSPGWVTKKSGTGPVTLISLGGGATPGGSGYANSNLIAVSNGSSNAAATLTTNATGGIATITLTSGGRGFINVATAVVTVTNATGGATGVGTGANLVITLGGRAGRLSYEQIVAFRGAGAGITGANTALT